MRFKLSELLEDEDSEASQQAKKLHLVYLGYGNYGKAQGQPVTHKSVNGKLVPVKSATSPATQHSTPNSEPTQARAGRSRVKRKPPIRFQYTLKQPAPGGGVNKITGEPISDPDGLAAYSKGHDSPEWQAYTKNSRPIDTSPADTPSSGRQAAPGTTHTQPDINKLSSMMPPKSHQPKYTGPDQKNPPKYPQGPENYWQNPADEVTFHSQDGKEQTGKVVARKLDSYTEGPSYGDFSDEISFQDNGDGSITVVLEPGKRNKYEKDLGTYSADDMEYDVDTGDGKRHTIPLTAINSFGPPKDYSKGEMDSDYDRNPGLYGPDQ